MGFESVKGYVQLASGLTEGLTELTRSRASEAAHGLLSLPAAGIATGSKVAVHAGALAEELLVAATSHGNLTALVRSEVDAAVTHLGLVPAEKLEESRAEAARLRAELARLRAASSKATASKTTSKSTVRRSATNNGAARSAKTTRTDKPARRATNATTNTTSETATNGSSAVTTRAHPARP